MNHLVPDFHDLEEDYSTLTPSGFSRPKKSATGEEDIMELLWQNGQVVVHSQNQRAPKKSTFSGGEVLMPTPEREIRSSGEEQQHLFMQEDEMASWLQYSLDESSFDRDLYADILYSAPIPVNPITTVAPPRAVVEIRPPPAPPRQPIPSAAQIQPQNSSRFQNFGHFSRIPGRPRIEPIPRAPVTTMIESTAVESNETPLMRPECRISHTAADSSPQVNTESAAAATSASAGKLAAGTCDRTVTSSPGGSGASFSASGEAHLAQQRSAVEDRKRKAVEADDNECHSVDIEFEAKKPSPGSTSTKRSRAAEVHNLSERRRRDRINEKMKALQELIPRCNKTDKASMLDEAIEYLKSLQMQVQMMSMGCGMVPMMYPGMQQYMPAMGMGMGMTRPMVQYPPMIPGSAMPNPAHLGPRFPIPPYQMPSMDPSRADYHMLNSPNQPRVPNFVDPYHQFLGLHQGQLPLQQNQAVVQPGANKPSSSRDMTNP